MKYTFALLFAVTSFCAVAQPDGNRKEKLDAMKIAFITQELDLTSQEAQTFWPVYNQFDNELDALRKARKTALSDARDEFDTMSDAELAKTIDSELNFQQQELDLRKKY